jgi:hypothetical protein
MRTLKLLVVCALTVPVVSSGAVHVGAAPRTTDRAAPAVLTVHRTKVRWGPFRVPAAMSDTEPGMIQNAIVRDGGCRNLGFCTDLPVKRPCRDCFITKIVPNLVDSNTGETINFASEGMLHHAVNLIWTRPDVTCPPGPGGPINWLGAAEGGNDRFFATGNERTLFRAPAGYGLPVAASDEWGLIVDLMNMMPEPRNVSLEYTFTWVRSGVIPLTPVWLDIDNCGDSLFDVPMGYSDTHWDWRSTIRGEVIAIAGHVHDNGISVAAQNVTTGRNICTSKAGYAQGSMFAPVGPGSGADAAHPRRWWTMTGSDHPIVDLASYQGHIAGVTGCTRAGNLHVGDTIRLHAQYNKGDMGHGGSGVMGIMVAYVDRN